MVQNLFWIQIKKIYVDSYKSININTDPWGTLLDCSLKFVHLFDSVYTRFLSYGKFVLWSSFDRLCK